MPVSDMCEYKKIDQLGQHLYGYSETGIIPPGAKSHSAFVVKKDLMRLIVINYRCLKRLRDNGILGYL